MIKTRIVALIAALVLFGATFLSPTSVAQNPATIDGTVGTNEYAYSAVAKAGVYTLYWSINETNSMIYVGIVAATTGWVAVGFDAKTGMDKADIYFGYVADGQQNAVDTYSDGPTGPHPADIDAGGTNDIASFAVTEKDGQTVFEFSRKLNTGDSRDNALENKDIKVIWAIGSSDDITVRHEPSNRGTITVNLFTGSTEAGGDGDSPFGSITFLLVSLALLSSAIALFRKRQ